MVLPKWAGLLSVIGAVLTALTAPELVPILGAKTVAMLTVLMTVIAAVSKALTDRDGDGKPDGI
jgi:uncharacterized membrane protein